MVNKNFSQNMDRIMLGLLKTEMTLEIVSAHQLKTDAQFALSYERSAKIDKQIADNAEQLNRTDAQLARTDAQLVETAAQLARTDAQLARTDAQLVETAAQLARTDAQLARTDIELKKLTYSINSIFKKYGDISDNLGAVAEEFFYNSLLRNPKIGALKFDSVTANLKNPTSNTTYEVDLFLKNGTSIALIEVKHKASLKAIRQLEKQVNQFREIYPIFQNHKLYAGIAGLHVSEDIVHQAHDKGFFVLKQVGSLLTADDTAMRPL